MRGDTIIVEPHHRAAAQAIVPMLLPRIGSGGERHAVTIAGESGSGKSETATALAEALAEHDISAVILQQDDYFVHPPKTNDSVRRRDIAWVGPGEVRLALLDDHLAAFLSGAESIEKPLVVYEDDRIISETLAFDGARVAIAEGTYTTLLENAGTRIFIARTHEHTRAHREKRKRDAAELDPFIDEVLRIEHAIICAHEARADIVIAPDYTVREVERS